LKENKLYDIINVNKLKGAISLKNIWTGRNEKRISPLPLLIFGMAAAFTVMSLSGSEESGRLYRQSAVKDSIVRAASLCYAAEGAYPESLDYLSENYGVRTEYEEFTVHYSYAGGNIPPDIIVTPKVKGN